MQPLAGFLKQLVEWIKPVALSLGGPGLFLVAFLDSSFLSLPEVSDILIVVLTVQHPARWLYYGLLTTAGSVAGCFALYSLARKGGEAFLRRWFSDSHVKRGLRIFQKYGLLAIIVPSLLPPPTPFKIFVLLAGVARVRRTTFLLAATVGRGIRYIGEAWLAYAYGDHAMDYIRDNLPTVSLWLAVAIGVVGISVVVWRSRRARA
ncbi:MAG TPA: VTT domain-containing protein [Vicinamibacterales bacterium]|nr:VTT domain-containing protein [Vicinamibacterales bacterium]